MRKRSATTSRRLLLLIACLLVKVHSWVASFSNGHPSNGHPSHRHVPRRRESFQKRQPGGGATGSASRRGLILSAAPTIESVSRCHISVAVRFRVKKAIARAGVARPSFLPGDVVM